MKRFLKKLRDDVRGNVLVICGLALPALMGSIGLAVEGASWYQTKRALQNAADQAVVAAATNKSSTYLREAKAITSRHGFVDTVNDVTVTGSNAAACPAGGTKCYSVTITKKVPLIFSKIAGFGGNALIGATKAVSISATAIAYHDTVPREYCILALATSGEAVAFQSNGGPKADLGGCNLMSNSSMDCNGHNLNAEHGDAAGTSTGCGTVQTSNMDRVDDPYSGRASKIPPNTCSAYPQQSKHGTLPSSNQLSGSKSYSTPQTFCGDVQLTGDVTLTGSDNIIVIRNGDLDLNGYTIKTASGAGATIIFSGEDDAAYSHKPIGSGTVDIAAPTSGDWSGVAIYQDPKLTTGVDITYAGNTPSWLITGLVYLPQSSVTFSGAVGKSTDGANCLTLVLGSITINGTGNMMNRSDCVGAGLTRPSNPIPVRGKLVA